MGVQRADSAAGRESELASRLAAIVESASVAIIGAALDGVVTKIGRAHV